MVRSLLISRINGHSIQDQGAEAFPSQLGVIAVRETGDIENLLWPCNLAEFNRHDSVYENSI